MSDERFNLPSASSFYADVACAGRQNLLRQLREQNIAAVAVDDPEMSELAARGTRIHEARRTGNTFALQEDELDAYTKACAIERQVVEDWMRDYNIEVLSDPIVEERLWLNREDTMQPILSGQLDVIHQSGKYACICDWKTSSAYYAGDVGKSWQTRIYALLAWKEWPQLKHIRVAFIKPEAFGAKSDVAEFCEYDLKQIEEATLRAVWRSEQPDAPLCAGSQCRWCPARAACPEAGRYATLPAVTRAADLESTLALIKTMPPEDALAVWQKRGEIKSILEAIEARLKSIPEEHERLGLKLTEGRKLDKIKDKVSVFNALRATGFSSEQIISALGFGKGELTKLYQTMMNCRDREAEVWFEAQLDEFIERGRAKPSLVEV